MSQDLPLTSKSITLHCQNAELVFSERQDRKGIDLMARDMLGETSHVIRLSPTQFSELSKLPYQLDAGCQSVATFTAVAGEAWPVVVRVKATTPAFYGHAPGPSDRIQVAEDETEGAKT